VDAGSLADTVCSNVVQLVIPDTAFTEAGATDDFVNMTDFSTGTNQATQSVGSWLVPTGLQYNNLRCEIATAPGGTDSWFIAVEAEDTTNAFTMCEIVGAATTGSDTSNVAVSAGKNLVLWIRSDQGTGDPTAMSGDSYISFCTTDN
jgi:hypothetical protein